MPSPLALALGMPQSRSPMFPSAAAPPQEQVAPTPTAQIYQNSFADQMAKYQAALQQRNAMWGGLAALGGTAALLPTGGGTSLGGKLIGNLFPAAGASRTVGALPTEAGVLPQYGPALSDASPFTAAGTAAGTAAAPEAYGPALADAGLGSGLIDTGAAAGDAAATAAAADAAGTAAAATAPDWLMAALPFLFA